MSLWYHPKFNIIGQLYPKPIYGPIYNYNRSTYRMYVSQKNNAVPIWTTPEEYGWVYVGSL